MFPISQGQGQVLAEAGARPVLGYASSWPQYDLGLGYTSASIILRLSQGRAEGEPEACPWRPRPRPLRGLGLGHFCMIPASPRQKASLLTINSIDEAEV